MSNIASKRGQLIGQSPRETFGGARRYANAAEEETGAVDEMAKLFDNVVDSRYSTCSEGAGFEASSVEL